MLLKANYAIKYSKIPITQSLFSLFIQFGPTQITHMNWNLILYIYIYMGDTHPDFSNISISIEATDICKHKELHLGETSKYHKEKVTVAELLLLYYLHVEEIIHIVKENGNTNDNTRDNTQCSH